MPRPGLKTMIDSGSFVLAPGVFDLVSALLADRMDFPALTGYGTVASHLGLPDAGLATYRDMLERIETIVERTRKPVIADADTGYGGPLNVRRTVRGYERAGVSAIQLEDQEFPKKCGHTPNRRVIPENEMVLKVRVAREARVDPQCLIIARTDALAGHGLDEAVRRANSYRAAGADLIFVESPATEAELAEIATRVDAPLVANMVSGGRTPLLSVDRLKELGFAMAIHPTAALQAAAQAILGCYEDLLGHGVTTDATAMLPFPELNRLLGFEDVWEFEKRIDSWREG